MADIDEMSNPNNEPPITAIACHVLISTPSLFSIADGNYIP